MRQPSISSLFHHRSAVLCRPTPLDYMPLYIGGFFLVSRTAHQACGLPALLWPTCCAILEPRARDGVCVCVCVCSRVVHPDSATPGRGAL